MVVNRQIRTIESVIVQVFLVSKKATKQMENLLLPSATQQVFWPTSEDKAHP